MVSRIIHALGSMRLMLALLIQQDSMPIFVPTALTMSWQIACVWSPPKKLSWAAKEHLPCPNMPWLWRMAIFPGPVECQFLYATHHWFRFHWTGFCRYLLSSGDCRFSRMRSHCAPPRGDMASVGQMHGALGGGIGQKAADANWCSVGIWRNRGGESFPTWSATTSLHHLGVSGNSAIAAIFPVVWITCEINCEWKCFSPCNFNFSNGSMGVSNPLCELVLDLSVHVAWLQVINMPQEESEKEEKDFCQPSCPTKFDNLLCKPNLQTKQSKWNVLKNWKFENNMKSEANEKSEQWGQLGKWRKWRVSRKEEIEEIGKSWKSKLSVSHIVQFCFENWSQVGSVFSVFGWISHVISHQNCCGSVLNWID